jgi:hypothetical protein
MKRIQLAAALAAGVSAFAMGAAFAQTPQTVGVGQTVRGELNANDRNIEGEGRVDEYSLRLNAGQGINATLSSDAFDAFLSIGQGIGEDFAEIMADDDSGGDTNSRLRFRAQEAGTYILRARALDGETRGPYALSIEARPPAAAPKTAALSVGPREASVSGALAEGGARVEEESDQLFDFYTVRLAANQVVQIKMSSEFDNRLRFGRMNDGAFEELYMDDDSGGDGDAQLIYRAEEAGTYTLRAEAFDGEGSGPYTLTSVNLPPPPAPPPRPTAIRIGQSIDGKLELGDAAAYNYTLYDQYELRGNAGDKVTIRVSTSEEGFDPYLEVGGWIAGEWASIAQNDDDDSGENGLNSKLEFTFKEGGSVILRARSLADGKTGAYQISVSR